MTTSPTKSSTTTKSTTRKLVTRAEVMSELKKRHIDTNGIIFPRHNLSSIKGQDELVSKFRNSVYIRNIKVLKDKFLQKTGKDGISNFYLFHGPTGSGKTYLAEAIAGSIRNAIFISIAAKDLKKSQYINVTQNNLEKQFYRIRQLCNCGFTVVVLFDEIETFISKRSDNTDQATIREDNDIVNRFLTFVRGVQEQPKDLIFIGTTNRYDVVDEAALEQRFEPVYVGYPSQAGIEAIVQYYLKKCHIQAGLIYSETFEQFLTGLFDGKSIAGIEGTIRDSYSATIETFLIDWHKSGMTITFEQFLRGNEVIFRYRWTEKIKELKKEFFE